MACYLGTTTTKTQNLPLQPMANTYEDVTKHILKNLEELEDHKGNQQALYQWFEKKMDDLGVILEDEVIFEGEHPTPGNFGVLENYFQCFNDLLFAGALPMHLCPLKFVTRGEEAWKKVKEIGILACTEEPQLHNDKFFEINGRPTPETIKSQIYIFEIRHGNIKDPIKRLRIYIGVLLHEMLHAAMSVLPCKCQGCFKADFHQDGRTGHGAPWFKIANQLSIVCRDVLKLALPLGRHHAARRELYHNHDIDIKDFEDEAMGLDLLYVTGKTAEYESEASYQDSCHDDSC